MSYIVAVDFDGTLCTNKYPNIGDPNIYLINHLKEMKKSGTKLILWTCRVGDELEQAIEWCLDQGLTFDAVNQNLPEIVESFGGDPRKVFANEYIDDRNVLDATRTITYLCNQKLCDHCVPNGMCSHTFNVEYAKNFKHVGGKFFEEQEGTQV